jgi:FkbM family methyltransferase
MILPIQQIVMALPKRLRRHKVVQGLTLLSPASRVQLVRFNETARAFVDLVHGNLRTVMINGQYDRHYFEIAGSFLSASSHYFDVGANVGLCSFGLMPLRKGVEYHLFEANPELWPVLRRSAEHHRAERVHLVEAALGARENERVFVDADNPDRDIGQGFISDHGQVSTKMTTLDAYVGRAGVSRVDFMKMDIEGYEIFAIEGADRAIEAGRLPVVYFELKKPLLVRFGKTVYDVLDAFKMRGYRLFHIRPEDFEQGVAAPKLTINGLPAAPVQDYPEEHWSDLLAVHESARHVQVG